MPLKIDPIEDPSMNFTAMLDVVFNLLIFFMVGTRFADMERQFDVQLPTVSQAEPLTNPPDEIVVNVFSDGRIDVGGNTLGIADLETRLVDAQSRYAEQAVMIRGDGRGVYQYIMDVVAVCHRARIQNLSLATQVGSEAPR